MGRESFTLIEANKSIKGYDTRLSKIEKNDCVVRSIANAFDIRYNIAHKFVKEEYKRPDKKGTLTHFIYSVNSKLANDKTEVFKKTLHELGEDGEYSHRMFTMRGDQKCKMTIGTFLKTYTKGVYIISVRNHSFCIKDGVVYGNYQDNKRLRTIVQRAWEVQPGHKETGDSYNYLTYLRKEYDKIKTDNEIFKNDMKELFDDCFYGLSRYKLTRIREKMNSEINK